MTKHIDRLMSRASVAAMAAFAPKPEPVSTLPAGAERVEDTPAAAPQRVDPIDGLSAEEQAGIDAMRGEDAGGDNVDHGAEAAAGGDADPDGDGDGADGDPAPADGEAAPAVVDGAPPRAVPKTINYGRHQKELAKIQRERDDAIAALDGSRKETAKEREERTRLDERSRLLLEAINTKAAPVPAARAADTDPEPNAEDDPIGHSQWEIRGLKKTITDMQGGQQRQQQATAAETEEKQVYDALIGDIQREASTDATMTDAFVHLRESRYQELGFIYANIDITDPEQCATLTPAQQADLSKNIQRSFHDEQIFVARAAIKEGKSPAAVVRNLARARGWKPGAAVVPVAGDAAPPPKTNGAAPPAAPAARAAAPAGSVKDQLNSVRDNLEASRSLSDAGGSPGGQMTPERLASMPEREFLQYYESMKDSGQLDSLMGRPDNM